MIKKYGTDKINSLVDIQKKRRLNSLKKYNVEFPQQTNQFKEKFKLSRYKSSYNNLIKKLQNYVIPLFSEEKYLGRI